MPPVRIIFIPVDSPRADHVRSYGYERSTTLNVDRVAQEGALVERVIAENSWTILSHVTMFTGVSNDVLGTHGEPPSS